MRNRPIIAQSAASCIRHPERPSVGRCDDCSAPLCRPCQITVADIGTFCRSCATRRGGLHVGSRPTYVIEEAAPQQGHDDVAPYPTLGVQVFEAMVGDREPHPLISGLTERLEDAGADPTDVVDDDQLNADIGRLQDLATAQPERQRRFRR
jgi:hypothetical protein